MRHLLNGDSLSFCQLVFGGKSNEQFFTEQFFDVERVLVDRQGQNADIDFSVLTRFHKPGGQIFLHVDGPIKTFLLRGIKESPPYLHDGRLLTLEDTVEFFNLVLQTQLNKEEKSDLVAFLRTL